jgi:hypothetical protein
MAKVLKCMGRTNTGNWAQETYETASRDAGRRSRQLRKLGYLVTVGSLGPQVTPLGTIKTTLVNILPGSKPDTFYLPEVEMIQWPR